MVKWTPNDFHILHVHAPFIQYTNWREVLRIYLKPTSAEHSRYLIPICARHPGQQCFPAEQRGWGGIPSMRCPHWKEWSSAEGAPSTSCPERRQSTSKRAVLRDLCVCVWTDGNPWVHTGVRECETWQATGHHWSYETFTLSSENVFFNWIPLLMKL